jgi:serine/threonine-protein kinase RsbW
MERDDRKRALALALHDVLSPSQNRGEQLAAGRDFQQLLATAQVWLQQCLERLDQEALFEVGLRDHLRALEGEVATPGAGGRGAANIRMSLDLPDEAQTVPLCRRVLRTVLQELSVEQERADEIELALSEATGNVIRHAYNQRGHRYVVEVEVLTDRLRLVVTDSGGGFLQAQLRDPDLERLGGRGLWLIERVADRVTVSTTGGGCRLEAEFALPGKPKQWRWDTTEIGWEAEEQEADFSTGLP